MTDLRNIGTLTSAQAAGAATETRPTMPTPQTAVAPAPARDGVNVAAARGSIPAVANDGRRDRAVSMAMAMLEPPAAEAAPTSTLGRVGAELHSWVESPVDTDTQVSRGLRLAANAQDPRLLPSVLQVMRRGGAHAEQAAQVFQTLLPYADAPTLSRLQGELRGVTETRLTTAGTQITQTLAQRQSGVAPQVSSRSGADLHWMEAGNGVLDFAHDITVGTVQQIRQDPLRFPTRMVAGMATSLHNAFSNTGGAVVGLVTAGAHGSFGAQMTQELANAGTWASGFARPRQTAMHPEFRDVQSLTREGFARSLQAWDDVHRNPVTTQRIGARLHLPERATEIAGRVESRIRDGINRTRYGGDIIYQDQGMHRRPGAVWKDMGYEEVRVARGHTLGTESQAVYNMFNSKWREYQVVQRSAPGAMPETHLGRNLIRELGMPKIPKERAARAQWLGEFQNRLNERFPEGYFIKGNEDWNTGGNLPTAKTDFRRTFEGYHREFVPLERRLRREHGADADLQPYLRGHEFHAGRALNDMLNDPTSVVIQPKLNLARWTRRELPRHIQPFQEFRVHVVRGQVIPGASSHRWNAINTITDRRTMHQAEAFVQSVVDKMPDSIKMRSALAPDVVQLADGSFRIIEVNPGGNSGFLHRNPLAANKLFEAVTGRETTPLYLARRAAYSAVASTVVATHQQESPTQPRQAQSAQAAEPQEEDLQDNQAQATQPQAQSQAQESQAPEPQPAAS